MKLLALLLLTLPVWAGCAPAGANRIHCASTGDPSADGQSLWDLLNNQGFPCGTTITLEAVASYLGRPQLGYSLPLKQQTGCAPGQYTTIMSTGAGELPEGVRVSVADKPKTARLITRNAYPVFELFANANNWKLVGLTMTTDPASLGVAGTLAMWYGSANQRRYMPENIAVERCIVFPIEEELYGDANTNNTEGRAFLRKARTAFGPLAVSNFVLRDSYIYGFSGYQDDGTVAFSSISNSNPAVITGTGIAAALGVSAAGATSPACSGVCNGSCYEAGGCSRIAVTGATGAWQNLNGPLYAKYLSADSVAVYKPNRLCFYCAGGTTPYDSSSNGSLTGEVELHKRSLLTQYGYYSLWSENTRIINNHIETWAMNLFLGGDTTPTIDPATVQSGSTATEVVLDHVRGLKPGDLIAVDAPPNSGHSVYCTNPGFGCWYSTVRAGKVTAITGTTVSVVPWGPDGIDISPQIGGLARWQGEQVRNVEIRRNSLYRNHLHPMSDAGKGPLEVKNCLNCLVDGNVFGTAVNGAYFVTTRNQGGDTVWMKTQNMRISNNLSAGPDGASVGMVLANVDSEHSNLAGNGVIFEHNLHPAVQYIGASGLTLLGGDGLVGSGWRHNTIFTVPNVPYFSILHSDCFTAPSLYRDSPDMILVDNILSYGNGAYLGSNCPSIAPAIRNNVLVDTTGVGLSAIGSALPGNSAVSDVGTLFVGTCAYASWQNCKLADASPYKNAGTDGKDPGADVEQVEDRINGWSEDAGLLQFNASGVTNNSAAFQIGSTRAAISFRIFSSGCTLQLFTTGGRTALDADTSDPAAQDCLREGNVLQDGVVTFVLGTRVPLQPSTKYYYRIRDHSRVMVGEFATQPSYQSEQRIRIQLADSQADNAVVEFSSRPDFSGATSTLASPFIAGSAQLELALPGNSVVYYRWRTRDASNTVLSTGSTSVAVAR